MKFKSHISRFFHFLKPNRHPSVDSYYEFDDAINYTWLCREHEIHTQTPAINYRTSRESEATLGEILSHLFDIKQSELSQLCINDNGASELVTSSQQIWSRNLLTPYLKDDLCYPKHVFYSILYRNNIDLNSEDDKSMFSANGSIMIHTSYAGKYKDHTMYLDVTVCINSSPLLKDRKYKITDGSLYKNFCIAYDFKKHSQAQAEYEFVKESVESGTNMDPTSLSQKEWSLLKFLELDLGSEYYWGKKAFAEHRYLDAILYLENVYNTLCSKWYKKGLTSKEMSLLTECSFLIGFSYNDLKLYDKAYHYLELSGRSTNKNHKYKKEFINCLVNSKNLLSIIYIDDYLQELKNQPDNERSEEDYNFFYFLLRRKAYILIEMEQLDDAEYILRRLLEKDPDNEIVLKELAFIQNQKKKEPSVSEEREDKK